MNKNTCKPFLKGAQLMVAACWLLGISCSKEGTLVPATAITKVVVSNASVVPDIAYFVSIDDVLIGDTLKGGYRNDRVIEKRPVEQHLVVKNAYTGEKLIDTMVIVPVKSAVFTILDITGVGKPVLYTGDDQQVGPEEKLWSFYYTDALLPDSLSLQMFRIRYDMITGEVAGVDTLVSFEKLKKNELAAFKLVDYRYDYTSALYFFELRDIIAGEVIPGSAFDPVYGGGARIFLTGFTEPHYINDIVAFDMGDGTYAYYSNTLLAY